MEEKKILELLDQAIKKLLVEDKWLLEHDLSEPCISHKLAEYLQPLFEDYKVDCEYNGNIERADGIKRISKLKDDLRRAQLLKEREELEIETEFIERAVLPDIVIHRRGRNDHNLCVIEVKKDTSKISGDYDYLKLEAYTSSDMHNDLRYSIGVSICFFTGKGFEDPRLIKFKDGKQKI